MKIGKRLINQQVLHREHYRLIVQATACPPRTKLWANADSCMSPKSLRNDSFGASNVYVTWHHEESLSYTGIASRRAPRHQASLAYECSLAACAWQNLSWSLEQGLRRGWIGSSRWCFSTTDNVAAEMAQPHTAACWGLSTRTLRTASQSQLSFLHCKAQVLINASQVIRHLTLFVYAIYVLRTSIVIYNIL